MSPNDTVAPLTDHDLHAFVDGELDGRRYRRIVAHLANDQAAAERVNGYLRQQGELAALREQLGDLDPGQDEDTAVLTRRLAGSMRRQRRVRFSAVAAALAATLLIGMVGVWGPDPSLVAQRLAFSRQVAEAGPQMLFGRDPLSGAAQIVTGVNGDAPLQLDEQLAAYSIRRPDLAAHGLRFVGGDALKGGDSPAIRLVYADDEDRRVFMFVGVVGSSADVALTVVPEGHISLNWRRGPLVFALIGPKDSEQLLEVMASTSELLAIPPTGDGAAAPAIASVPPTSDLAATELGDPVGVQQTDSGIGQASGAGEIVQPEGPALQVTPAIVIEGELKPL
jgi:anti-sigma factor RsiW